LEHNTSPENSWLEDDFPFKMVPFQGTFVHFGGGTSDLSFLFGSETFSMFIKVHGLALGTWLWLQFISAVPGKPKLKRCFPPNNDLLGW